MAGLNKEIWIDALRETTFYGPEDFMSDATDYSVFVDNDKINLAEVGAPPNVEKNRVTYPIPVTQRTDTALVLSLDEYSSDNTLVQDAETAELVYDKVASIVSQHRMAIADRIAQEVGHNVAPLLESTLTPVLETTGADNGAGLKAATKADIFRLKKVLDDLKYPVAGRTLVLTTDQFNELLLDPTILVQVERNQAIGVVDPTIIRIAGFTIRQRATSDAPLYEDVGGVWTKQDFGKVQTVTDFRAGHGYIARDSFWMAKGTLTMYESLKDPLFHGDIFSFRQRAAGGALDQRKLFGLVSVAA